MATEEAAAAVAAVALEKASAKSRAELVRRGTFRDLSESEKTDMTQLVSYMTIRYMLYIVSNSWL